MEWLTMETGRQTSRNDWRHGREQPRDPASSSRGVKIHSICQAYEVPFFTDAVQFIGKMPMKGLATVNTSAARRTSLAGRAAWAF